jgi:hypothetical protein
MKICPECININFINETCSYCGFPFNKKILGNFDEFYFYDVIEKFNNGDFLEAKNKLQLNNEKNSSNKLLILDQKIIEAEKYIEKSIQHQKNAENYLSQNEFKKAFNEIDLALTIDNNNEVVGLKNKIKAAEISFNNKAKAKSYFEQGLTQIQSNDIENGLNNIKTALKLDPENPKLQSYYKEESEKFVLESIQKIKLNIQDKKYKNAQQIIDQIRPFITSEEIIYEHQEKIHNNEKKLNLISKSARYVIYTIIILFIVYFTRNYYLKYQDEQDWIRFTKTAKIDDYRIYLSQNPNSPYFQAANDSLSSLIMIDSITWAKFLNAVTVENAQNYIKLLTPKGGSHLVQAQESIDSLDWLSIELINDPVLYDQYIANHPTSKYINIAKQKSAIGITGSDKQNMLNLISSYFAAITNNDIESIMNFFGPTTTLFENQVNVTKADIMQIIQSRLNEKSENNITMDNSSIKIEKDKEYNFMVSVNCDEKYYTNNENYDGGDGERIQQYENVQYFFTISPQNKILTIKSQKLSQSIIN